MARKTGKKSTRKAAGASTLTPLNCESDIVRRRLDRIQLNYDLLDQMLADLESRVPEDPPAAPGLANPGQPR